MHSRTFNNRWPFGLLVWLTLAACQSDSDGIINPNLVPPNNAGTAEDTAVETEIEPERMTDLTALAQEWVGTRDDSLIDQIQNEQELSFVQDLFQQWQQEIEGDTGSDQTDPPPPPMASCSGYWGTYRIAEKAELLVYGSGVYRNYWSPNCAMPAPGNDCGTDHDDYMVSFWMGPDYTYVRSEYKTDSSNWSTYWHLVYHGGGDARIYTSNSYGAWYGNAYVCLSNTLDPNTLRFGRRY